MQALLNYLIRPRQHRLRDREAERLGGLEIYHQLKLRRLLDRQIGVTIPQPLLYRADKVIR